MTTITATLRNAVVEFDDAGEVQFIGNVYGDTQGRFLDGQRLVIGPLLQEIEPGVFVTPRGTYRVIPAPAAGVTLN